MEERSWFTCHLGPELTDDYCSLPSSADGALGEEGAGGTERLQVAVTLTCPAVTGSSTDGG